MTTTKRVDECVCGRDPQTHAELVLALIRDEITVKEIREQFGYPRACIEHWQRRFLQAGREALADRPSPARSCCHARPVRRLVPQAQRRAELRRLSEALQQIGETAAAARAGSSGSCRRGWACDCPLAGGCDHER